MRILSRVGVIVGIIALVAGIGVLSYALFQVWQQYLALSAGRSKEFVNPVAITLLGSAVLAVGAFVIGFSLHRGIGKEDIVKPDGTKIIR